MMEYQDFISEITKRLQQALGDGYQVSIQQLCGNNGVKRDAAVISELDGRTAECLSVSGYYKLCRHKADMDIIVRELVGDYLEAKSYGHVPDLNTLYDWNRSGENVMFRLVNSDANRELLQKIPHFEYFDLSQVFYLLLELNTAHSRSILITDMLMEKWGISADELLHQAQKNTPVRMPEKLVDMHSLLSAEAAVMTGASAGADIQIYVLTNQLNLYGAGCILYEGLLKRTAEKLGTGFYVLPSSLHEVILIPAGRCSLESARELKQLVMTVNRDLDLVPKQDILSDSIFYYNKEEKHFSMVL